MLSVSQLRTLLSCPTMYYLRYIKRIPRRTPASVVKGIAYDEGANYYQKSVIEGKPDKNGAVDKAMEYLEIADEIHTEIDWGDGGQGTAKDEVYKGITSYVGGYADTQHALDVQHRYELTINEYPVVVIRDIDSDIQTGVCVIDNKFAKRKPSEISDDLQAILYGYSYELEKQYPNAVVAFDYCVVKKRNVDFYRRIVKLEDRHRRFIWSYVSAGISAVKAGIWTPAPPNSWWCGEKCPYYAHCPWQKVLRGEIKRAYILNGEIVEE